MSLTNLQVLAVKCHNCWCTSWKSGQRIRCPCGFILKPKHQPIQFKNPRNQKFLKKAKFATHIIQLESVSEEDILNNYEYYKHSYYLSHPEDNTNI